ncbi:codanin-1 [Plodia interpunctella]|uniref:codanin-1 n=1 Tax=Plodia interpunctella TaxID=58824 RepID=UPI002367E908|nr:codanin-1 [Plodia interpunctella]
MPETIIESVLSGKIDAALLLKWLDCDTREDTPEDCVLLCCNRSEFVAHFLSYLRNQTDSILRSNSNAIQLLQHQSTPEKILSSRRKHRRSISDPTSDDRTMDSLSVRTDRQRSHESPSKDKKRGRRVKTKLFTELSKEQSVSSDESRLSIGLDRVVISSTPLKNGRDYPNLPLTSPVTPKSFKEYERCDTPRLNQRHSRSHEKSCLGDYLVTAQKSSKKRKGKNTSNDDADVKVELDLSNSEQFPEIGVRKSSSLRSERRRIKPTNIDRSTSQKSFSLNSFTSECFQQPSPLALEDNIAFKAQNVQTNEVSNSFETERNILKQERHKLMEKFNILNTSASPKTVKTPQIKVIQNNSIEKINYIKSDANKVVLKDKIDILVDIYNVLLKKNLILSVITEIYFLISIILSKQSEIDYEDAESNLKDNHLDYLLKSIHNSTYFAVKCLWNQRIILEVILDKNSLKTLGENKKIRSFYPDLAKFLLNSYGLKCEAETTQDKKTSELRPSNGVICFNLETDNVDNFPSALSFQSFKKQRDMFYEILRWYQESQSSDGSRGRASFRARIKPLLSAAASAANHAHLAALFTRHMLAALPHNTQESKLSKLQRRLTCPSASDSHRLPHFTEQEMFYKEFVMNTDNESFRVHLRDKLSSEIIALDSTPFAEDRNNAHNSDLPREYLALSNKLQILSKLLGYLYALPYCINVETGRSVKQQSYATPKDKVLENDLALRNYSQPSIDLQGLLTNAQKTSRLCITLPWIIHFLSMLDYTSLRIKYYQRLIKTILEIYSSLKIETKYKKNTLIFLKSILGWLFDLPHFPIEFYYEISDLSVIDSEVNIDSYNIIDETVLFELCPYLKDVNVLLSTCKVGQEQKESFRHITPVSLSLNPEDRMRNKEKELQNRLEEELLKSQPASTRRVLELVCDRVTSLCVRHLSSKHVVAAREKVRLEAMALVKANSGSDNLLQSLQSLYTTHAQQLCASALQSAEELVQSRSAAALEALLPHAPPPILKLAVKGCLNRLGKWLRDNWNTTAILCKDIEAEMKTLIVLGDSATYSGGHPRTDLHALVTPQAQFEVNNVSPSNTIIQLKEQICLLLEYSEPANLSHILCSVARCCSPSNVFARALAARALLRLSSDLCLVFVSRKPLEVNDSFLNQLHNIWNTCCPDRKKNQMQEIDLLPERRDISPEMRNFEDDDRVPTPVSDDENQKNPVIVVTSEQIVNSEQVDNSEEIVKSELSRENSGHFDSKSVDNSVVVLDENNGELLESFDRILCPRNIVLLSSSKCKQSDVWESLATVLVFLLKNDYLSEDSLTEQCLAVYRQDWPQNILESLSSCMKSVSSRWSRSSTGKFTLFLDFLAEYCGDLDYEPME